MPPVGPRQEKMRPLLDGSEGSIAQGFKERRYKHIRRGACSGSGHHEGLIRMLHPKIKFSCSAFLTFSLSSRKCKCVSRRHRLGRKSPRLKIQGPSLHLKGSKLYYPYSVTDTAMV